VGAVAAAEGVGAVAEGEGEGEGVSECVRVCVCERGRTHELTRNHHSEPINTFNGCAPLPSPKKSLRPLCVPVFLRSIPGATAGSPAADVTISPWTRSLLAGSPGTGHPRCSSGLAGGGGAGTAAAAATVKGLANIATVDGNAAVSSAYLIWLGADEARS